MNPNAEREIAKLLVAKANEAVNAVGPVDGRSAEEIANRLGSELEARGINLDSDTIKAASGEIARGKHFEFR